MGWNGEGEEKDNTFYNHHIHPIVIVNTAEPRRGTKPANVMEEQIHRDRPVDFTPSSRPQCGHPL